MNRFQNKVALVTGATSGIGRVTAAAFAREGAKVVLAGRREADGQKAVAEIQKAGGQALFVRTDVANEAEVSALVGRTLSAYGRLDVAFNNAGIEQMGDRVADTPSALFDQVMSINVKGVFLSMKYEIPAMLKSGGGAIVNTASVAGLIGFPGAATYVASKHAVVGYTKAVALEYAKEGIRVNAISPGGIETPMLDRFTGGVATERGQFLAQMHPIGRIGRSEEIADAVLWLCSEGASFVTGQSLAADGGFTAQ